MNYELEKIYGKNHFYHYTSFEAFKNIMESGIFRLTHLKCLDDISEGKEAVRILQKYLPENEFQSICRIVDLIENSFPCSFSMCQYNNEDFLWREYANKPQDVCFELDAHCFSGQELLHCVYHEKEKRERVKKYNTFTLEVKKNRNAQLINNLLSDILLMKECKFSLEKESRYIDLVDKHKDELKKENGKEFYEFNFDYSNIYKIWLNPKAKNEHKLSIENILKDIGFYKNLDFMPDVCFSEKNN